MFYGRRSELFCLDGRYLGWAMYVIYGLRSLNDAFALSVIMSMCSVTLPSAFHRYHSSSLDSNVFLSRISIGSRLIGDEDSAVR